MNNLMIFENKPVEVFEWNGQALFNPYDCGDCLDLEKSSVRNYLSEMNERQSVLLKNSDVLNKDFRKLNNRGEKFLTESGIYKLIFKSKKKEAERFQDWVTDEVLPQIRKTGQYQSEQKAIEGLNKMVEDMQKNLIEQKETIEEYKSMCKISCSKKRNYTDYIKKRLGITKANSEFEQVKARVFLILNINKWEDVELETSKNILTVIDESITVIKRERPYKQMSYFDEAIG
ncbi:BRO-N domain-containing protein [Clostridium perfringens]